MYIYVCIYICTLVGALTHHLRNKKSGALSRVWCVNVPSGALTLLFHFLCIITQILPKNETRMISFIFFIIIWRILYNKWSIMLNLGNGFLLHVEKFPDFRLFFRSWMVFRLKMNLVWFIGANHALKHAGAINIHNFFSKKTNVVR